ncbi:MAG: hypothetical protein O3A69_09590 [Proteobacteria bacterium]|nr:hypothetical protein [Pseudomonadota bacterium]
MDEAEVERIRDVLTKYENFDLIGVHANLALYEADDLVNAHAGFIPDRCESLIEKVVMGILYFLFVLISRALM